MRDETIPPALPIFDSSNPHTVAHHIEGHFGVSKQPQLLTNCLRDRHLSFLRDSHCFPLSPVLLLPLIVLPARGSVKGGHGKPAVCNTLTRFGNTGQIDLPLYPPHTLCEASYTWRQRRHP